MDFETKEIGLSQSSTKKTLSYDKNDFVTNADGDTSVHGRKLSAGTKTDYTNGYVFEDDYLIISLFVNCNWNQFVSPGLFTLKINGNVIFDEKNIGVDDDIHGSRTKDSTRNDTRVLLHFNVPTSKIKDKEITKIECSCHYGFGWQGFLSGTWTLSNCTVYQGYYWYNKGGSGYWKSDWRLSNYEKYSSNRILPQDYYDFSATLSSYQTDGSNESFFTENYGKMKITFTLGKYLSGSEYQVPLQCVFYGTKKDGTENSKSKYFQLSNSTQSEQIYEYDIESSSDFEDFSEIKKIKITVGQYTFEKEINTMQNIDLIEEDIYKNAKLSFSISNNLNNNYVKMSDDTITLKSSLKGSLTTSDECPFAIISGKEATLINAENNTTTLSTNITSDQSGAPIINKELEYTLKPKDDLSGLTYENGNIKPFSTGTYLLKCYVENKLMVKKTTPEDRTIQGIFNVTNLEIQTDSSKWVSLKGVKPAIYYIKDANKKYLVPGSIIMPGESLIFSNNDTDPFYLFNLSDLSKKNGITEAQLIIDSTITEHKISKSKDNVQYGTLKNPTSPDSEDTEKTTPVDIKYKFSGLQTENVYQPTYSFILGRKASVVHKMTKIEENSIRYILTDNGGDRELIISNGDKLSSNELITQRKQRIRYLNLARQANPGSSILHEELQFTLTPKNSTSNTVSCRKNLTDKEISMVLDLLKEDRVNTIPFTLDFWELSSGSEGDLEEAMNQECKLEIKLFYIYEKNLLDNSGQNDVKMELFSITENSVSFVQRISPLGLRNRGVIVNPEKNQDLDDKNTFIINVKDVVKNENSQWNEQNGLKIVFQTDEPNAALPLFEVILGQDGKIYLSNGSRKFDLFNQTGLNYIT